MNDSHSSTVSGLARVCLRAQGNGACDTDSESFSPIQVGVAQSDKADISVIDTYIHISKRSSRDTKF